MKPSVQTAGLTLLAVALAAWMVGRPPAAEPGEADAAGPAIGHGPIVVELFTSQGCSSCPPADRLLRRLAEESGDEILPLAFHVDYWNRLGWRDPFSSAVWSERQERYARALAGGRVYTPQLVVDGRAHVVGSDERAVLRQLEAARQRAEDGQVELAVTRVPDALAIRVVARTAAPAELLVAITESGFETPIDAGENARRRLENDFVVRRLDRLATLESDAPASHEIRIPLAPAWRSENLAVVAFLQDPRTLAIAAAAGWRPGER